VEYKDYEQEYISGGIRLYQADCMKMLSQIPDKYYSLCIVDPPYGIGASNYTRGGTQYGKSKATCKEYGLKKWDSETPSLQYFEELKRVSKQQIIWGGNYFILSPSSCWIVWDKDNGDNGYADCELAWTSFKTAVRKIKYKWHGMLQENMKNKESRIHPTQKPVKLYEWLLKNYAKPGDKILDTHLGSGSSAIACYNMGFALDGFEIDVDYFNAAVDRLEKHKRQGVLFTPKEIF